LYTFKGGIKTIVWTDTLQTLFILSSVVASIYLISTELNLSTGELISTVENSNYSRIFDWDWASSRNFFKLFLSGALIAIVMTGMDQDMMQKNLTCPNIKDAQKNMLWFTIVLVFVNLLFLGLGALLFIYSNAKGIPLPDRTDELFPTLALHHFSTFAGIIFLLGIVAAAYSSADSALTALTTSFCVDFLGLTSGKHLPEDASTAQKSKMIDQGIRMRVHIGFCFVLFLVILIFQAINDESVINAVFKIAGYTYGPLLGMFSFGLSTRLSVKDKYVPAVCLLCPIFSYIIDINSAAWFNGFQFGFFILMLNGVLTYLGLLLISKR
jgi:Na+/proline symporter